MAPGVPPEPGGSLAAPSHQRPGVGAAVRDRPANSRPRGRPGYRSLPQGPRQPWRLQVRDRPGRAGPSLRCAGSRSHRYSSRSPSPRAMSRRSLRSAKNRRRGGGCSRTHSVYMNCPMHQHAPNATLAATSIHHATANTSHSALPSCCHASPYGSRYLNLTHLNPEGRTEHHDHRGRSGRVHRTPKYTGGKGQSRAADQRHYLGSGSVKRAAKRATTASDPPRRPRSRQSR